MEKEQREKAKIYKFLEKNSNFGNCIHNSIDSDAQVEKASLTKSLHFEEQYDLLSKDLAALQKYIKKFNKL
jgi:hypothetical protein